MISKAFRNLRCLGWSVRSSITRHATALLSQGRMRLLARWFRALPEALLTGYPLLPMVAIWATGFTRGPREAMAMPQARSG